MIKKVLKTLALEDIIVIAVLFTVTVASAAYEPTQNDVENAILLHEQGIIVNSAYSYSEITKYIPFIQTLIGINKDSQIFGGNFSDTEIFDFNRIGWSAYATYMEKYVPGFKLGDTITRREFIKIVMNLSGGSISNNCEGIFKDISSNDWGCKYAEAALKSGIIDKNMDFNPDGVITKVTALKMILKSKNIPKINESSNWKQDYVDTAYEYGLIENKFIDYDTIPNRAWIFDIGGASITKQNKVPNNVDSIISDEAMIH